MKKILLLALVLIVVVFGAVVSMRPNDFRVVRSAAVDAPAAVVFAQVNDMHKWQAWSPWAKMDPQAKVTYSGPVAGLGASFAWAGNNQIGAGQMTVSESQPNKLVRFNLEFFKPFKGTNIAEFTFQPYGPQTIVTWTMTGHSNFIAKAVGLFIDCDKMIGDQFEKGLANLNAVSTAAKP